jgi:hypothetical protein
MLSASAAAAREGAAKVRQPVQEGLAEQEAEEEPLPQVIFGPAMLAQVYQ